MSDIQCTFQTPPGRVPVVQGGADGDDGDGPARAERGHYDTAARRRLCGQVLRPQLQDATQTGNVTLPCTRAAYI